MKLNANKTAIVFAVILGGWHLLWSILVFLNVGQLLLDFVFWMHMITNPYQVSGFTPVQSLTLIIVTALIGYIGGYIFAWVWNTLHK